ncbi:MAG: fibronectin type III domain-containing protein [Desulfobacterales bacterium]|nr:MAG: fibronectin type III domain-containing protein [Desulfobacterales bacterium]
MMIKRLIFVILPALVLVIAVSGGGQAFVIEDSLMVTDVTPVKFSVVWATSEPATAWVNVFLDADGTIPCAEAKVESESAEHPPAEELGVMKVQVGGLQPDTDYYFQIVSVSKTGNITYVSPSAAPFSPDHRVRTEKASRIVRNDVLVHKVSDSGDEPSAGMLVIASVAGASYPVSGWVGQGVPDRWAPIDANNFYDMQNHVNLELVGGEKINLTLFGGLLGFVEIQDTIPEETGGMQQL